MTRILLIILMLGASAHMTSSQVPACSHQIVSFPSGSIMIFANGILQKAGASADYLISTGNLVQSVNGVSGNWTAAYIVASGRSFRLTQESWICQ